MRWNWRFWQSDKDRLTEKAVEETRMTPYERDVDQEDYEARKEDLQLQRDFAGSEALDTARDDLAP
jgi:hypothetical protein